MFVIDTAAVEPRRPKVFGGGVVVYVRPCTSRQLEAVIPLAGIPVGDEGRARFVEVIGPHVSMIDGLAVRVDGKDTPIRTLADAVEHAPGWVAQAIAQEVIDASMLSARDLGNSAPPSHGAATGGTGTAPLVDPN